LLFLRIHCGWPLYHLFPFWVLAGQHLYPS
jgi:hypothetical protein